MKRSIAVLTVVLAVAACRQEAEVPAEGPAASFTAEDEAALRGMFEEFVVAFQAEDWTSLASYYAEDAVRMPPDEPAHQGHEVIIARLEELPPVTGFSLTPQAIEGDGDLAYARGTFTLDLAPPDGDPIAMVGKWQAVYERQADGSWLCVSDIWNTDSPMAQGT